MRSFAARSTEDEWMDGEDVTTADFAALIHDLAIVNTVTLARRPTLNWLKRAARDLDHFSLVDVGSGEGDMLRAVIEGLNFQFLEIVKTLHTDLDVPFDRLIVVGGATRNSFWMQNKADMVGGLFGRGIEVSEVAEATPLGAAMLAGIGVGLYRDEGDALAHVQKPGVICEPNPDAANRYAKLFPIYQQIYPALKSLSHSLSESV